MTEDLGKSRLARATFDCSAGLTVRERNWVRHFGAEMARHFAATGVVVTPLTILRLDELVQDYLAAHRLSALAFDGAAPLERLRPHKPGAIPEPKEPPHLPPARASGAARHTSTSNAARCRDSAVALVDAAAKARERMRKTMSELEGPAPEVCAQPKGIADVMRPILKAAHGVLEESLVYRPRQSYTQDSDPQETL